VEVERWAATVTVGSPDYSTLPRNQVFMNLRKFLPFVVAVLLLVVAYFNYSKYFTPKNSQVFSTPTETQEVRVSVKVDYGTKANDSWEVQTNPDESALSVLQQKAQVEIKEFSFGKLVEGINGVRSGNGNFWIYYVNGQTAAVGADQYRVKAGDVIEWKLEEEKK